VRLRFFPREDIFFDLFEAAADNVAEAAGLLRDMVDDFVDPEMKAKRLADYEHEGDRLYRRARAELYAFDTEHPARYVLVWKDIIEQLEEAMDALEHVAHTVESIVLKHA
jgi:uncharacterized protein